jgi:hypothetical protein
MGWQDDPVAGGGWQDDPVADTPKAKPRVKGTGIGLIDQTTSSVSDFLVGVPEGLVNMASTATDAVLRPFVGDEAVRWAQQARGRTFDAGSRALASRESPYARMGGQIASTIPLAKARIAGKAAQLAPRAANIATRALQGAMGGAAVRDSGGDDGTRNAMIGAGANVVLPPALGALVTKIGTSRPVQALSDRLSPLLSRGVNAIDDVADDIYNRVAPRFGARPLPKVDPAILLRQSGQAAQAAGAPPVQQAFGPAAQRRLDDFRKVGVKNPTTGMVTRDPAVWTYERNTSKLAGIGDDLVKSFQDVDQGLDDAANRLIAARGGARNPEAVGEIVEEVLTTKRKEMQAATGQLYKAVREQRGNASAGSLDTFLNRLDAQDVADDATFDSFRESVMRRLSRFGMAENSGLIRNKAVASVEQAESLRSFIGNLGNGADPNVRRIRAELIDALDDDVVSAVGDDAFKAARASARARFEEFSKTFAGRLADGKVTSEKMVSRILSGSNKDLRALRESLNTGTPEQIARGQTAWNDIGAQAVDDFFSKARGSNAEGTLSAAKLSAAFKRDGAKLKELLTPEEFDQIAAIVRASQYANTAVPFSAVNNSNTTSAAANLFAAAPGGKPGPGRQVMTNILQHVGAGIAGTAAGVGPTLNVALAAGKGVSGSIAARNAAKAALDKVNLAKSPEAAAAALKALQAKASRDAAFRAAVKRWQDGGFYSSFAKWGAGPGR